MAIQQWNILDNTGYWQENGWTDPTTSTTVTGFGKWGDSGISTAGVRTWNPGITVNTSLSRKGMYHLPSTEYSLGIYSDGSYSGYGWSFTPTELRAHGVSLEHPELVLSVWSYANTNTPLSFISSNTAVILWHNVHNPVSGITPTYHYSRRLYSGLTKDEWIRYDLEITIPSDYFQAAFFDGTYPNFRHVFGVHAGDQRFVSLPEGEGRYEYPIWYAQPKLELGHTATPWMTSESEWWQVQGRPIGVASQNPLTGAGLLESPLSIALSADAGNGLEIREDGLFGGGGGGGGAGVFLGGEGVIKHRQGTDLATLKDSLEPRQMGFLKGGSLFFKDSDGDIQEFEKKDVGEWIDLETDYHPFFSTGTFRARKVGHTIEVDIHSKSDGTYTGASWRRYYCDGNPFGLESGAASRIGGFSGMVIYPPILASGHVQRTTTHTLVDIYFSNDTNLTTDSHLNFGGVGVIP